ncbi:transporter substrate-binding domain-containing protein [Vibrio profundum]|uniref:substrate-binding periplasmic protein n=1 Tax=Vibrio profundum TaxID=2910247 RepID=UPI003D13E6DD
MRWCQCLILCAVSSFLLPTKVSSEVIKGVCNEKVVPHCFEDDGKVVGIFVEVAQEIGARMNLRVDMKPMPMKRILLNMKDGGADITGPLLYSDERAKFVQYLSAPVFIIKQAVYGREGDYFPYQTIQDLYGKTVGKRRGFHLEAEFAKAEKSGKLKVFEANSFSQLFNLLSKDRVKYIIFPEYMAALNRSQLPSDAVLFGHLGGELKVFMAISRNSPLASRYDEMNLVLTEMEADGTLQRIRVKYLPQ